MSEAPSCDESALDHNKIKYVGVLRRETKTYDGARHYRSAKITFLAEPYGL